jgi:hypothetical protein
MALYRRLFGTVPAGVGLQSHLCCAGDDVTGAQDPGLLPLRPAGSGSGARSSTEGPPLHSRCGQLRRRPGNNWPLVRIFLLAAEGRRRAAQVNGSLDSSGTS